MIRKINVQNFLLSVRDREGLDFSKNIAVITWEYGRIRVAPWKEGDGFSDDKVIKELISRDRVRIPRVVFVKAFILGPSVDISVRNGGVEIRTIERKVSDEVEESVQGKSADA